MEKLIELLKQIQELAGVAVHALEGAGGGEHGGEHGGGQPHGGPPEGSPAEERGEPPAEAAREGDAPRQQ